MDRCYYPLSVLDSFLVKYLVAYVLNAGNAIPLKIVMPSTKYEGLKSKGGVIRDNFKFLEYRTKQVNIFER